VYARSTTVNARPELVDEGIRFVTDEVMPMVMGLDGCVGLSMIVDRESGRCITTSAWRDEESMRAADSHAAPMRARAAERLGADLHVEEWEIAALHRAHPSSPGACVRVTWLRADPAHVERAVDVYRMSTLPSLDDVEGFCSASLLVDRSLGMLCSSATYSSADTMMRSREKVSPLREAFARDTGATVTEVREFELALAHLHVPEMA
jgi:hypothetical protein